MKQTIVIKVSMSSQKCRSKAMKITVGVSGVDSAALKGDDKNLIEVTGEGIDVVELTKLIRKNVGGADLVSVGEKKEEKKDEKKEEKKEEVKMLPLVYYPSLYQISEFREPSYDPGCSIM